LAGRIEQPREAEGIVEPTETSVLLGEVAAAYTARLGKWSREVLEAIRSPVFWGDLLVSHLLRGPLQRLLAWLQAAGGNELQGGTSGSTPAVVEHVAVRAAQRITGYEGLLSEEAWQSSWKAMREHRPEAELWRGPALLQLMEIAADAYRRLLLPTTEFPMMLAWVSAAPPERPCGGRSWVCSQLLGAGQHESLRAGVDTLSDLLRRRFRRELRECVDNGGIIHAAVHKLLAAVPQAQSVFVACATFRLLELLMPCRQCLAECACNFGVFVAAASCR
jgi:hypothetical protein